MIDVGGKRVVIEIAAGDVFVFRELGVKFGDAAVEIGALNFRLVRGVLLQFVEIRIAFDGQVVAERVAVLVDRLADDGRDGTVRGAPSRRKLGGVRSEERDRERSADFF